MTLRPYGARLIVRPEQQERVTASGLHLPERRDVPERGVVVAVGPGARQDDGSRVAPEAQAGDRVLFQKYAGHEFKSEGGETLLVIAEHDLLAKIEEAA